GSSAGGGASATGGASGRGVAAAGGIRSMPDQTSPTGRPTGAAFSGSSPSDGKGSSGWNTRTSSISSRTSSAPDVSGDSNLRSSAGSVIRKAAPPPAAPSTHTVPRSAAT